MERLTLADRVYNEVRARILDRRLARGERLNISALAADLNVSQTPVREALARLEKVGLVSTEPYIGSRVRAITVRGIRDIYQVRIALEPLAMRLFVSEGTDEHLAKLASILRQEESAAIGDDDEYRSHVSYSFHTAIADATGNASLAEFIRTAVDRSEVFWSAVREIHPELAQEPGWAARRNADHWRLLRALERREAEEAVAILVPHLGAMTELLTRSMSSQPAMGAATGRERKSEDHAAPTGA